MTGTFRLWLYSLTVFTLTQNDATNMMAALVNWNILGPFSIEWEEEGDVPSIFILFSVNVQCTGHLTPLLQVFQASI